MADEDGDDDDDRLVLRTTRLLLKRGTLPSWAPKGIIRNAESWVMEETEVDVEYPAAALSTAAAAAAGVAGRGPGDGAGAGAQGTTGSAAAGSAGTKSGSIAGREMRVWTRNLDHTNVMAVTEGLRMTEQLQLRPPPPSTSSPSQPSPTQANYHATAAAALLVPLPATQYAAAGHILSSYGFALLQRRIERFGLKRFTAHADTSRAGLDWTARTSRMLERTAWDLAQVAQHAAASSSVSSFAFAAGAGGAAGAAAFAGGTGLKQWDRKEAERTAEEVRRLVSTTVAKGTWTPEQYEQAVQDGTELVQLANASAGGGGGGGGSTAPAVPAGGSEGHKQLGDDSLASASASTGYNTQRDEHSDQGQSHEQRQRALDAQATAAWLEAMDPTSDPMAAAERAPRLRAVFRPPFLDGYPATPLQRLRNWWKGKPGVVQQAREAGEFGMHFD